MEIFLKTAFDTITITALVLMLMIIVEYINIKSQNKWFSKLQNNNIQQIFTGTFLGAIPGCVGGFAGVSLYAHDIIQFPAMFAIMIASFGDEALVMFASNPKLAIIITAILALSAIIIAYITSLILKNKNIIYHEIKTKHIQYHGNDYENNININNLLKNITNLTFSKVLIILLGLLFIFLLITNRIGEPEWSIDKILYIAVISITIIITLSASNHFIEHHIWQHIIKKHLPLLVLWTFLTLLLTNTMLNYINIQQWIQSHIIITTLVAIIIGIIPQSGPHLIFFILYSKSIIPFHILLINSFMQDGHIGLPLLAESPKTFFITKLIKIIIIIPFIILISLYQ